MKRLANKLAAISVEALLDVATGKGDFLALVTGSLAHYGRAVGVDVDEKALAAARERFGKQDRIMLRCARSQQLPFDDGSFDLVCISNALHHMPDNQAALDEMKRVCRHAGMMIISEMYRESRSKPQEVFHEFHDLISEMRRLGGQGYRGVYTKSELAELMAQQRLAGAESFEFTDEKDPSRDQEDIRNIQAALAELLDTVADMPQRKAFARRVELLKSHIEAHGVLRASQLVIIGRVE